MNDQSRRGLSASGFGNWTPSLDLDYAMGLVVNGHDDVAYVINTYGRGNYGR